MARRGAWGAAVGAERKLALLWAALLGACLAPLQWEKLGAHAAWEVTVPGAVHLGQHGPVRVTNAMTLEQRRQVRDGTLKVVPLTPAQAAHAREEISKMGGVAAAVGQSPAPDRKKYVPTPREAAPKTTDLENSQLISESTKRILREKCTNLPKGVVPPASMVLNSLGTGAAQVKLGNLLPHKSNIFVHRDINKPPCMATGGNCISNFTLLRDRDEFLSKYVWERCAVVGNSGSLLATRYGEAIDKHDLVVRMNIAPVEGKEEFVGSKTNLRMINSKGSSMVGVGPKTALVVRVVDTTRWYGLLYRAMLRRRPDVSVILLNTNAVKGVQRMLEAYRLCFAFNNRRFDGGVIPSSGLVLALALSQMCDQTNVYGFGRPRYMGKLVPYQYYIERNSDGSVNQGSQNHAFGIELLVLKELARASGDRLTFCGISEQSSPECKAERF